MACNLHRNDMNSSYNNLASSTWCLLLKTQANGQAKATNKFILTGMKKRVGKAKGLSVEELHSILWTYHCTSQSTPKESPFRLTMALTP